MLESLSFVAEAPATSDLLAGPALGDRFQANISETLASLVEASSRDLHGSLQIIQDHAAQLKSHLEATSSELSDLSAIESAVKRAQLVNALLSDLGQPIRTGEAVEINEVVRNLASGVQTIRAGRPTFSLELTPNLPSIEGSHKLTACALITLFLRAAREMSHEGVIHVRTGQLGSPEADCLGLSGALKDAVWISIKDESPGYPLETKEQICRHLQDKTPSDDPEIALVQEVASRQEGRVLLESQAGRGTTWTLYLPTRNSEVEFLQSLTVEAAFIKGTILLVDDEPLVCGIGRRILETSGYHVITASSGSQALEAFRSHLDELDLVLLDVILPDQNGLEVLKSIRKMSESMPVLISSGYTTEYGIRDQLQENGAGFIEKPYRVKELLAKLEATMTNAK